MLKLKQKIAYFVSRAEKGVCTAQDCVLILRRSRDLKQARGLCKALSADVGTQFSSQ